MPASVDATQMDLHAEAERKIREYVGDFATSLVLQAKLLAFRKKAELVLSKDVDEARNMISAEGRGAWSKETSKIVGGALFGAFIPGFITAAPLHDTVSLVIYTVLGFMGMFLVFLGL